MRSQKKTPTIRLLSPLLLVPGFRFLASLRRYAFSEFNGPPPTTKLSHPCISPSSPPPLLFSFPDPPFLYCPVLTSFDSPVPFSLRCPGPPYPANMLRPPYHIPSSKSFFAFMHLPVISGLAFLSLSLSSLLRVSRYELCPRLGVVSR